MEHTEQPELDGAHRDHPLQLLAAKHSPGALQRELEGCLRPRGQHLLHRLSAAQEVLELSAARSGYGKYWELNLDFYSSSL